MRLIILAAGQGFKLDGINKLFIKDPRTKETVIERYIRYFKKYKITVVVGYRATEIMCEYPELDYVYNDRWRTTGNSYGLGLALDDEPCIVVSSDLFFDEDMVKLIEDSPDNCVFVSNPENKELNTLRCKMKGKDIEEIYMGNGKNIDPITLGIYKIKDKSLLREWKRENFANPHIFAGVNLPLKSVCAVDKKNLLFFDINTHEDYLRFIKDVK